MEKLKEIDPKKLKKGDILVCNSKILSDFTEGKEYTIEGFYDMGYGITTTNDINHKAQICNDLVKSNFLLVTDFSDNVNHPSHYTSHPSRVECIEITIHYCFAIGNAIKYLWRAGLKKDAGLEDKEKEIEDLRKAKWYIDDRIKQLGGKV